MISINNEQKLILKTSRQKLNGKNRVSKIKITRGIELV
ncbi:hypothetical protein MmTuc01_0217 [Methanosarcina mazei Tuc01]|uniref:Uncharacterized protein n=1 Tax=Methanosarcina mazei Tuc01 TaxID=1236903 RepID=M1P5L0_METMZ|nr:hypothetical protein MmTuc01_0217 [Methanosarcina mazei Tuc01]